MYIEKSDGLTLINLDYVRELAVSENRIVYRTEDEKVKVFETYDSEDVAKISFRKIVEAIKRNNNLIYAK